MDIGKIQFIPNYNINRKTYRQLIEVLKELPIALDLIKIIVEYNSYCRSCRFKYCLISPY